MPIVSLFWPDPDFDLPNASDVHVVHGHPSPSLLDRLHVADGSNNKMSAAVYLKDPRHHGNPPDVTFVFRPLFAGALSGNKKFYAGRGVVVDVSTGEVEVTAALSAFIPLNFVMEIVATNTGTGQKLPARQVRVQVHGAVLDVWLTPNALTVRRPPALPGDPPLAPRDTGMRFLVRAKFDDGLIGDLTLGNGTTWLSDPHINDEGRLLVNPTDGPGTPINLTATLDPRFGGPSPGKLWSATAKMHVQKGWHELTPAECPEIELVNTGVSKKARPETEMPNVVLMSDGWGGNRAEFVRLTNELVMKLRTSRLLRPFPHLIDSMCIWRWFVPSPDPGFSVVSEVYLVEKSGPDERAIALPHVEPPSPNVKLTVENLLYVAGLPMPGDEKRSAGDLRKHWKATCSDFNDSLVDTDVIEEWSKCGRRTFVDCVDTEFHAGLGGIPGAEMTGTEFFGFPTAFRGFENLTRAKTVLTTKEPLFGGRPLAELWSDAPPGPLAPRFDNRRFFVCFVPLPGARGHSTGTDGRPAMVSTRKGTPAYRVRPSTVHGGYELMGEAVLPTDLSGILYTFVHELSHAFGLGDEYAEHRKRHSGTVPEKPNLQGDSEVRNPAKEIDGTLIRWNWHRIQAAALIEGPIKADGSSFVIDVHPGHATQFSQKQEVLLRLRKFRGQFIIKPTVLPFTLRIEKIVGDHRLVVIPTGTTNLATLQTFEPGSIVFLPINAPPTIGVPHPYMRLITQQIRDWISHENAPLWAADSEPKNLQDEQGPKLPGLVPLWCFKNTWRVIGLYEGGDGVTSGVYHPAGGCLMRIDGDDARELCAVCRYVLTDIIDPSLHNANDAVYREIYNAE